MVSTRLTPASVSAFPHRPPDEFAAESWTGRRMPSTKSVVNSLLIPLRRPSWSLTNLEGWEMVETNWVVLASAPGGDNKPRKQA